MTEINRLDDMVAIHGIDSVGSTHFWRVMQCRDQAGGQDARIVGTCENREPKYWFIGLSSIERPYLQKPMSSHVKRGWFGIVRKACRYPRVSLGWDSV